jgi:hypothetical protein
MPHHPLSLALPLSPNPYDQDRAGPFLDGLDRAHDPGSPEAARGREGNGGRQQAAGLGIRGYRSALHGSARVEPVALSTG